MKFLTEHEPARGEPHHIAPGIRRIVAPNPGPMTYWGTNTYLIDAAPSGLLLLDPGPDDPAHIATVLAVADAPIIAILLTHSHADHLGATAALRAHTGAPVHAWHTPAAPAFTPDVPLHDGATVFGWTALHTPGHASDHLCFAGPNGILFSADHVMAWSTSVVGLPDGNMGQYINSLERLLTTDFELYLPGHGPKLTDPIPFVRALLEHRLSREAAITGALTQEAQSAAALVSRVYPSLAPSLARAAERSVTAHLGLDGRLAAERRQRPRAEHLAALPGHPDGGPAACLLQRRLSRRRLRKPDQPRDADHAAQPNR